MSTSFGDPEYKYTEDEIEATIADREAEYAPPTNLREAAGGPWVVVPADFVPAEDPYTNPREVAILSFDFSRDHKLTFFVLASILDDSVQFARLLSQIRQEYSELLPDDAFAKITLTDRRRDGSISVVSLSDKVQVHAPNADRNGSASDNAHTRPKPDIVVTDQQLGELTNVTISALYDANAPPKLYVRSGELVRLRCDEKGRTTIESLTDSILRKHMSDAANFYKESRNGQTAITPPIFIAKNILALEGWNFPALSCVVEIPVLRPDGSIVDCPGYDQSTGVYYRPDPWLKVPPISESPSRDEIKQCVELILEAIGEFPYVDEASRANAIALLLTPLIRQAIKGVVPIGLIDAVNQGTGKSLLSDVISLIPTGRTASMTTMPGSEEEWRKRLTSELYSGTTLIFIDNISGRLDSPTLASVLTAWTWKDRWLGVNKMVEVPNRATWIGNGNNIQLGGDMQRRAYWIRMDAKSATPWTGREFKHPDLIAWVIENRANLIAALLTLARAWYAAGQPNAGLKPIGRFEEWSEIVTGVLAHAGVKGCLENLKEMYDTVDEESAEWERFLGALGNHYGARAFTTAEIARDLNHSDMLSDTLPEELANVWNGLVKPLSFNKRLGNAFRTREKRRYGASQHRIERTGAVQGAIQWRVVNEGGRTT